MTFYTAFTEHYEAIFPFSEVVYDFLRRWLPAPPSRVLDVGCGTGHYTGSLAAEGFDAVGVDLDAAMIDYARSHYREARFWVLDMMDIARLDGPFDGVFCIGNTAAHLEPAAFGRFLDQVQAVRASEAPWVLQVMNWDYVLGQERVTFPVIRAEDNVAFYREYRDISSSQVTFATRLEVGDEVVFEAATPLYPLPSAAIVALHRDRGFELLEHLGSYAGTPFDPGEFSANIFVFR
ncbi:MAG: class I SAM-dependent methyltransferase [Anaerolineae bacterium]